MKSLRITLVLKTSEGGRWVVPHLEEMLRRGHKVTVIIPEGPGKLKKLLSQMDVAVENSSFDFSFRPSPSTLLGLLRLRRQIAQTKADVLHYHLYASALAVRLAAFGIFVPKVHMVAGPLYLDSRIIRWVERRLMYLDTLLVAGSSHTAERYRALGLQATRLVSIPYGIDTTRFREPDASERSAARNELGLGNETFVAVMVAYIYGPKSLVHQGTGIKGHEILLDAWQKFVRLHPDSKLLLVGSGFDETGIAHRRELILKYADPALNIEWVDNVADVRPYYWASNVSVSPSLSENHGAALEAGACGVTRIVSDAGGLPETTNSASGWVVPRGDSEPLFRALEEAYGEFVTGSLAAKGRTSRRQVVASFNDKESACALVDVLEAVALDRKSRDFPNVFLRASADRTTRRRKISQSSGMSYFKLKRVLDIVFSGFLLLVTLPLQAALYAAVLATLGRPVLFRQSRPGLNGEAFELIKFRTMRNENPAAGLMSDAERMTSFGSFLRRTSLDELPTLANVLRGDMSMVGPRPLLTRYLDRYTPEQRLRHDVRPGITGLAQVRGRNALEWEEKLRLDVDYVRNVSLRLDLLILVQTLAAVARSHEVSEHGHATKSEFMGRPRIEN